MAETEHPSAGDPGPNPCVPAEVQQPAKVAFPVVGVGASAGGVEALTQLLAHLPESTGMAFLVVQHLDPKHESHLAEVLTRASRLQVVEARDGMAIRPECVYVIPPNATMGVAEGLLRLTPRAEARGLHLPVDYLFRSLASEFGGRCIGVVLSGSGADGSLGLPEIKAAGGITFAQDERSARYASMPTSATAAGCVDFVLPPEGIARELSRIGGHAYLVSDLADEGHRLPASADGFKKVLALLRTATKVDFSQYRDSTVRRRIQRRLAIRGLSDLADYLPHLEQDPAELEVLYNDLLINVTSFFRDPELFEALKTAVFPHLLESRPSTAIRVWVPGCSTGQEAYSLAMALLEFLETTPGRPPIQIFATDIIDPASIDKARAGFFPESIEADVAPQRLRRFFTREDGGYRIAKSIRDLCVFARQNLAADPPFSHIDLISCRNVLIYFAPPFQRRVISMFHYAANPNGFLVLGCSETVGGGSELFELVDRKYKIYAKQPMAVRPYPHFTAEGSSVALPAFVKGIGQHEPGPADFQREADRIVLGRFAPAGVLINANLEVLQFRGRTGPYLEPPVGEASFHVLRMARANLAPELGAAIRDAQRQGAAVSRRGVRLGEVGQPWDIDLEVLPVRIPASGESCFLVLFQEAGSPAAPPTSLPVPSTPRDDRDREFEQLRRDLATAREYLQSVIEQQDAYTEELRSANEEVLSSNEELLSTNEELETAKEELESSNEELTTVNEELQTRNSELYQLNTDLAHVLGGLRMPLVMLGTDRCIRRANPAAHKMLNLVPSDVGRPISDLKLPLDVPDLEQLLSDAVSNVTAQEREVRDREGRWFALRIHPCRRPDNRIDGAILALVDIDDLKHVQARLQEACDDAEAIVRTVRQPLLILSDDLRVQAANRAFYETFQVAPLETVGRPIYELGNHQWDIPRLRTLLEEILPFKSTLDDFEVKHEFPSLGHRTMLLNVSLLRQEEGQPRRILLAIEDVTEERALAEQRGQEAARKDQFLATLSHELRNPLASLEHALEIWRLVPQDAHEADQLRQIMQRQTRQLGRLIDDLLDVSRIARGKIELQREPVELSEIVDAAVESSRPMVDAGGHQLSVTRAAGPVWLEADPARLVEVVSNLLNNAAKYTPPGGEIWLIAEVAGATAAAIPDGRASESCPPAGREEAVIRVRDSGVGIAAESLPHVFDIFWQADISLNRSQGGLGIGLTLVKSLVEMHGGTIQALSAGPGRGSEFIIRLPLATAAPPSQRRSSQRRDRLGLPPRKVLVVDDLRVNAHLLGKMLEAVGQHVRIVHDGQSALEAARAEKPDLVISDIAMPGMNGYELAERLRAEPGLADVVLVALTGHGQDADRQRASAAGFQHHLVKPVSLADLEQVLWPPELRPDR